MVSDADVRLRVLHGVRLKGFAEAAAVADVAETDLGRTTSTLDLLVEEGLVTHRDGRLSGYTLTPGGRAQHSAALAAELERTGARAEVEAQYRRFLVLNPELLAVCTAWQVRTDGPSQTVNDHTDPAYDHDVIARLADLHRRAEPVCAGLAATLERFAPYGPRLGRALARVQAGEHDWFTKPVLASYHTVWFELHEDLLVTLGLERSSEVAS